MVKQKAKLLSLRFLRCSTSRILEVLIPTYVYEIIRSILFLNVILFSIEVLSAFLRYVIGKICDRVDIKKILVLDTFCDAVILSFLPFVSSKALIILLIFLRRIVSPLRVALKAIYTKLGFSDFHALYQFSLSRALGRTFGAIISAILLLFLRKLIYFSWLQL